MKYIALTLALIAGSSASFAQTAPQPSPAEQAYRAMLDEANSRVATEANQLGEMQKTVADLQKQLAAAKLPASAQPNSSPADPAK